MPKLTPEIEQQVREAAEKATPRPWKPRYLSDDDFVIRNPGYEIFTPEYDVVANVHQGAPIRKVHDAALIALAANHILDALADLADARRERDAAMKVVKTLDDNLTDFEIRRDVCDRLADDLAAIRRNHPHLFENAEPQVPQGHEGIPEK